MYEYKYVDFNHTMGVVQAKMDDYQGIIHEEAKRGWHLVQIFATKYSLKGIPTEFQLIFERKIQD